MFVTAIACLRNPGPGESLRSINLLSEVAGRARGVVGYHARLALVQKTCERGPVQSRTCPFFSIAFTDSSLHPIPLPARWPNSQSQCTQVSIRRMKGLSKCKRSVIRYAFDPPDHPQAEMDQAHERVQGSLRSKSHLYSKGSRESQVNIILSLSS